MRQWADTNEVLASFGHAEPTRTEKPYTLWPRDIFGAGIGDARNAGLWQYRGTVIVGVDTWRVSEVEMPGNGFLYSHSLPFPCNPFPFLPIPIPEHYIDAA